MHKIFQGQNQVSDGRKKPCNVMLRFYLNLKSTQSFLVSPIQIGNLQIGKIQIIGHWYLIADV